MGLDLHLISTKKAVHSDVCYDEGDEDDEQWGQQFGICNVDDAVKEQGTYNQKYSDGNHGE